ncbi:uncharacterized protein BDV14DRAFT_196880 [Aspergillus stella-maris]|uniref:uncharacterized protein n=1 Tax=Aspergillus stella-maris TaxID=1810926 RepID=UPI003CCD7D1F
MEMESEYIERRKSTNSISSTTKSLFVRTLIRKDTTERYEPEDAKGPLGLTTLHNPGDKPVVELIFVHGLNGGSQSTWTKNDDSSLYWPKEWLPKDKAFQDVRIHTFGYASGLSQESFLDIPDFARSLLYSVHDSPLISKEGRVPLIFVGHSMGGLVVKKAYILGHDIPEMRPLVSSVCAIFFLATPHQGANIAQTLSRIVQIASGTRAFVQDLFPGSPALESINEEFPRHCSNLQLFSFFENKPMNYVIGKGLIVEKKCAVMNYVNERRAYLNANHRDVARFSSPSDSSYIAVRNALATYIDNKRDVQESENRSMEIDQLTALSKFLGISDAPENDCISQDSVRFEGSCDWFLHKSSVQQWYDSSCSKLLWIRGQPGAGKSVLASYLINYLRKLKRDCSFFFFSNEDKSKTTINSLLRSLAWQMALMHDEILQVILGIAATLQDTSIGKADHGPLWQRLYLRGILKVRLMKQQYLIIDALDECKAGAELMSILTKVQEHWPLSILVTSRTPVITYMNVSNPAIEVESVTIEETDTKNDIFLLLQANIDSLPSPSAEGRQTMADEILQASNGCFLWVDLVLKELRQVNTSTEIRKVLASNSKSMDGLYSKILTDMADARFGKDLGKAFLIWAVCSFRPLSTREIHQAIELDIKDTIDDVERSLSTCCRNIVYVDNCKEVRLIHLTAREFLLRQDIVPEFTIDKSSAHKRLTLACLRYLSSSEMKAPRSRRVSLAEDGGTSKKKQPFADYACKFIFQHLPHVKSTDDEVLAALTKFLLSSNVLSWIEYLASHADLQLVFYAGKAIDNFLARKSKHTPPFGLRRELVLLQKLGNDLIHLVTRFSKQLLHYPSSIYNLVPPLCPRGSTLRQLFGSTQRGLSVYGLSSHNWDDCLSTLIYPKLAKPVSVVTSSKYFAIGMSTGSIIVYDSITCEESQVIENKEPVWGLSFGETGKYLASFGVKTIRVWDIGSWAEWCTLPISSMCMTATFIEEDRLLLAALKNNQLAEWDISSGGTARGTTNWTRDFDESYVQSRQPTRAAFFRDQNLLAVVYRGEDILLWDFELDRVHDIYGKEHGSRLITSEKESDGSTTVWALAFSSALADAGLLVASYSDGDLVIYDTSSGGVREILNGVNAQTLACSFDGRTLATADSQGTISLFDLETFRLLYRLHFDGTPIGPRALAFTIDDSRLIDVRGNQCRIWDPIVLLRRDIDEVNSDTVSVSTNPQEIDYETAETTSITSIFTVQAASVVFYGKEDGSVHVSDITSESQGAQQLFVQTPGVPVTIIYFDTDVGLLTCGDSASRVVSRKLRRRQRSRWEVHDPVFDMRVGRTIKQLLTRGKHSKLLIATDSYDALWSLSEHDLQKQEPPTITCRISRGLEDKRYWIHNIVTPDHLLLIMDSEAKIYSWGSLDCLGSVTLNNPIHQPLPVNAVIPFHHQRVFATTTRNQSSSQSSESMIQVWDLEDFTPETRTASPISTFDTSSSAVDVDGIVGVRAEQLIYLDTSHWVCSIDISKTDEPAVRHFFIPSDWMSSTGQLLLGVGREGEIIFVKTSELAIVKQGLDMAYHTR